MADAAAILEQIRADDVRTVDFRFTDLRGQWQHLGARRRRRERRRCSSAG